MIVRAVALIAAAVVVVVFAAGDLSAAGTWPIRNTGVERGGKVAHASKHVRAKRARAVSLAELRAGGWVTYDEAIARGLPWVKPEKLMGGMRWCTRNELNLDNAGVDPHAPPPPPGAPECQAHQSDIGAMVPGTRAAYEEAQRAWAHSAALLLPEP